jgi:hypothetical protein
MRASSPIKCTMACIKQLGISVRYTLCSPQPSTRRRVRRKASVASPASIFSAVPPRSSSPDQFRHTLPRMPRVQRNTKPCIPYRAAFCTRVAELLHGMHYP